MDWGVSLTLWSIRAALVCYAVVIVRWAGGAYPAKHWRVDRALWTVGCALFLVHLFAALHYFHHDSHAAAVADTARKTQALLGVSVGVGLYFNYLFALVWLADVGQWWWLGRRYFSRPRWLVGLVRGYLLFIAFNSTVVFATGPARWGGIVVCVALAILLVRSRCLATTRIPQA